MKGTLCAAHAGMLRAVYSVHGVPRAAGGLLPSAIGATLSTTDGEGGALHGDRLKYAAVSRSACGQAVGDGCTARAYQHHGTATFSHAFSTQPADAENSVLDGRQFGCLKVFVQLQLGNLYFGVLLDLLLGGIFLVFLSLLLGGVFLVFLSLLLGGFFLVQVVGGLCMRDRKSLEL